MLKRQVILALALAAATGAQPATAQIGGEWEAPANLPPDGFTGVQFVDDRGCVFVRAGMKGDTQWIPRVTRSRQQVCGQTPSFRTTAIDAPATTRAASAEDASPAPAPARARETAAAAQTSGARPPVTTATPSRNPRPLTEAPARAPKTAAKPASEPRYARSAFDTPSPAPKATTPDRISSRAWIVPTHVWEGRVAGGDLAVPPGYQPVWTDGRLNRWRAWQKVPGQAATQQIWTDTVPRRAVPADAAPTLTPPAITGRVQAPTPPAPDGFRRLTTHPMYD